MNKIELSGLRFGRLLVHERADRAFAKSGLPVWMWNCSCDCGNARTACTADLTGGKVKSCGCLRGDNLRILLTTHGEGSRGRLTKEYKAWKSMLQRCEYSGHIGYKYYGGRGIKVCKRWHKYENFLADVGRAPSPEHSIDRKNTNGHYKNGNVRWATRPEQARNRRVSRFVHMPDGTQKSLAQVSEETGIKYATLFKRLKDGRSFSEITSVTCLSRPSERLSNLKAA